jgi:hypothetical protein
MTDGPAPSVSIYFAMEYILIDLPRSFLLRATTTLNIDAIHDVPVACCAACEHGPNWSCYLITLGSSGYRAHRVPVLVIEFVRWRRRDVYCDVQGGDPGLLLHHRTPLPYWANGRRRWSDRWRIFARSCHCGCVMGPCAPRYVCEIRW